MCLIGYLKTNQLAMALDGVESENYNVAIAFTKNTAAG
jgi:hypothetical protein